ncbi:MAG: DUF6102 family protein [Clostridiales Family XIII bacterium]|nr:DUF6102 family protein [Clostridiales Family XIII bacterium]
MELILIGLIVAIILGSQFIVDAMLNSLIPMAFYAERYMHTAMGGRTIDFSGLYDLFFGFGVSLIVLKFLKKGFDVYVGWFDGDPDLEPLALAVNFLRAMAVALCFPTLYDALIRVTTDLIDATILVMDRLTNQQSVVDILVNGISNSIFMALAGLMLVIVYIVLWVQFMMRGIEMMVMRVGMPIACVGLIDGDKGIFAPYMKKFFMNAATVLIQIALVKLSLTVMILGNCFYALAIAFVAMKTPRFLQEFTMNMGGAGAGAVNTVYHTSRLYQMAKSAIGK